MLLTADSVDATIPNIDPSFTVYVDEEWLSFHVGDQLETTFDMIETTVGEAYHRGAVPCSACFDQQDSVQYPFQYLR